MAAGVSYGFPSDNFSKFIDDESIQKLQQRGTVITAVRPLPDSDKHGQDDFPNLLKFSMLTMKRFQPSSLDDIMSRNMKEDDQITNTRLAVKECGIIQIIGADCTCTIPEQKSTSIFKASGLVYCVVESPYMLGKISCAEILGNLYAKGVIKCDNLFMFLGIPLRTNDIKKEEIAAKIIKGFKDCASEAGTVVSGPHCLLNPSLIVGGTATSVCDSCDYIDTNGAKVGDVLVLTKPLGTRIALLSYAWMNQPGSWDRLKFVLSADDVTNAYRKAVQSMAQLNKAAANLMRKYNVRAATKIGEGGILTDAKLLAQKQNKHVNFVIHNLPVIAKMALVNKACHNQFGLKEGTCPETSGGMLICMKREDAARYIQQMEAHNHDAWIIGVVESGNGSARFIKKPCIIEVPLHSSSSSSY